MTSNPPPPPHQSADGLKPVRQLACSLHPLLSLYVMTLIHDFIGALAVAGKTFKNLKER
jgi:hypothetical protein